jgi:hypothetical protein
MPHIEWPFLGRKGRGTGREMTLGDDEKHGENASHRARKGRRVVLVFAHQKAATKGDARLGLGLAHGTPREGISGSVAHFEGEEVEQVRGDFFCDQGAEFVVCELSIGVGISTGAVCFNLGDDFAIVEGAVCVEVIAEQERNRGEASIGTRSE